MEHIKVEMTLQRKDKPDIRVMLFLEVEEDEVKNISFEKLQTIAEMN